MEWNEIMARELKKAQTGSKLENVPKRRKPSAASLLQLENAITSQLRENEAMCTRSKSYASSTSIM